MLQRSKIFVENKTILRGGATGNVKTEVKDSMRQKTKVNTESKQTTSFNLMNYHFQVSIRRRMEGFNFN